MSLAALPDLHSVRRLLIIRLSAIGDVVHALPVASALGTAYPNLEITWLVEEISADMVIGNPYLHEVVVIPRSRWNRGRLYSMPVWREYAGFLRALRRRRFDLTIDLQGYGKSALMALATGARYRLGWWRMRDGSNLVSHALPRRPESVHRVDWFLDTVRALGVTDPHVAFPLYVPPDARLRMRDRLLQHGIAAGQPFVVINQAAGNPPRRWGLKRYAELTLLIAERLHLPTVLVGTQPESPDCDSIVSSVRAGMAGRGILGVPEPLNLAGKTSLKELAALLDASWLHISGDTGSTHIAAALGCPVVAFYGSTDPAHAGPWGQMENVLARRDLCHANCTVRQCAYGPGGMFDPTRDARGSRYPDVQQGKHTCADLAPSSRCLAAISVEEAMTTIVRVIGNRKQGKLQ